MSEQEWRDVCGYGGVYQVSNDGCVRRAKGGPGAKAGRILKPSLLSTGYLKVSLSVNDKAKTCKVHQLVAMAFIPNTDDKDEVDHVDRDRQNNHVTNLRWATRAENAINTAGRTNSGIKHISRTLYRGKPAFRVSIQRGGKHVVNKYFYIKDRDEADVLAEAEAYRNEVCAELGIAIDDK
jgi:hypothetical protein